MNNTLWAPYRKLIAHAAGFSFVVNMLLVAPSIYMLQVFDRVMSSRSNETLILLTLITAGCLVAMVAIDLARSRVLMWLGVAMDQNVGAKVLRQVLADRSAGDGRSAAAGSRDVMTLRGFLTGPGILALFDAPWLPVYVTLIGLFHPLLGAVALGGALTLLALTIVTERISRQPLAQLHEETREAAAVIDASVRNAEAVRAMGMTNNLLVRWQTANERVLAQQVASTRATASMSALTKFVRQLIQILVMAAGAYLVIDLNVTAGVMLATTVLLSRALSPVESAIAGWKSLVEAHAAAGRLEAILRAEREQPPTIATPLESGEVALEKVQLNIGECVILKPMSIKIAAGETVGIVGPSGSGKSTLARILVGAWLPSDGVVRFDGVDRAQADAEEVGARVGYLPQDVELFAGTVAENIARMGEVDRDAVVRAAQRANVHDMILRLPQGYATTIGDGGARLSGGQRQRIGLARALYGDPRMVVLDEPGSALDIEGGQALRAALAQLKRECVTVFVVTHQPALLGCADKILVLRQGAIESFGPREALVQRGDQAHARIAPVPTATQRSA